VPVIDSLDQFVGSAAGAVPVQAQIVVVLGGLLVGLAYSVWFRRDRGALFFLALVWALLAFALTALVRVDDNYRLLHELLPWNLLLLAVLPVLRMRSLWTLALIFLLAVQLVFPVVFSDGWASGPKINLRLFGGFFGESDDPLMDSFAVAMIVAAVAQFVRMQVSDDIVDFAGFLVIVLFLATFLIYPAAFGLAVGAGGVLMMVAVLYSSHRITFYDALTGVRNRRSLDAAVQHLGKNYAIGMLDVDHFKRINDRFGHDFGDQVLKAVAKRARSINGYTLYRYGGEEFCMLFRGRNVADAAQICEEARAIVGDTPIALRSVKRPTKKPVRKNRYREKVPGVKVTVSVGLARWKDKYASPDEVREAADKALYRAKKNGRNRVAVAR